MQTFLAGLLAYLSNLLKSASSLIGEGGFFCAFVRIRFVVVAGAFVRIRFVLCACLYNKKIPYLQLQIREYYIRIVLDFHYNLSMCFSWIILQLLRA